MATRLRYFNIIFEVLREKYPNTEFFLARIFLYSVWIRRFTKSPYSARIQENIDQKKTSYLDTFYAVKLIQFAVESGKILIYVIFQFPLVTRHIQTKFHPNWK